MGWVSLLAQAISLRKSILESRALAESAQVFAEKGKNLLFLSLGALLACVFFLAAIILFSIEIGMQIERGSGIYFSGLMASVCILLVCGALVLFLGFLPKWKAQSIKEERARATSHREERIKEVLEVFVVEFLSNLSQQSRAGHKKGEARED